MVHPLLGNIFSNFFTPQRLFCLNDLRTCLSSFLKAMTVVNVKNDISIRHDKVRTAMGVVS